MQSPHCCLVERYCKTSDLTHSTTLRSGPQLFNMIMRTAQFRFTLISPQQQRELVCLEIILPTCKHVNWSARWSDAINLSQHHQSLESNYLQLRPQLCPSWTLGTKAAWGFISCEQIWQLDDLISPYKAVTLCEVKVQLRSRRNDELRQRAEDSCSCYRAEDSCSCFINFNEF